MKSQVSVLNEVNHLVAGVTTVAPRTTGFFAAAQNGPFWHLIT